MNLSVLLLHTKFLVPQRGSGQLPRPHLIEQLERQLNKRLILLSTAPGYGKTTLLAELAAVTKLPYAWYQLDAADGDPNVFLSYLVECLRRIHHKTTANDKQLFGNAAQSLLDNTDTATVIPPERILTVLINELVETITDDWLIILEDYHLITNPVVHRLVDYLIENAPPGLHLLISTRIDPPFALARLRARGMLAELRANDLRFTHDEVGEWLTRHIPDISKESVYLLGEKTEGWAAALQIALSSLSGKDAGSADRFITQLSGTHRFIFEYLAEEVFQQQPPARQQFLTHTAVLGQMNAAVCNTLLDIDNAQASLESLEQDNLFIVSLDEQREWHRYHHLFRDFLLGKLRHQQPGQILALEIAAGAYYERQNEPETALAHYLQGNDFKAAARVITGLAPDYLERGRVEGLQRYLSALPEAVIRAYPDLLLYHGDVLRQLGQAGTAIGRYQDARTLYETGGKPGGVCHALTRLAEMARSQGDYWHAQTLATEARTYAPANDHAARANALIAQAKSEGFLTGMDRGRALAQEAITEARLAGDAISPRARANLLRSMGQICWWQGDPQTTIRYCQEVLQSIPDELSPLGANTLITMATPYLYWRDLDMAHRCAWRGLEIAQQLQLTELLPRAYTTLGNVLTRRGELVQAESYLRQAVELTHDLGLEAYTQVMAIGFLAYNLCRQERVEEARQMAEAALWSHAANANTYELYVCRSVLADIALEMNRLDQAENFFESLLEVGQRRQFRIPLAMVYFGLAYIYLKRGQQDKGAKFATQSLAYIEPTGALQLYLDQGDRARIVCQTLLESGVNSPFIVQVLENLSPKPHAPVIDIVDKSIIRVDCLGPFRVYTDDNQEVAQEQWVSTKARDLLAYFVTVRGERLPIDRAFDAVWPNVAGQGKTAFHTALHRLRQALRLQEQAGKFILVKGGEYWLDSTRFHIDVDEFDAALTKARTGSKIEAAHWYEQAISLYQGEYLSNLLYYDWAMVERRRLNEAYLAALQRLAAYRAAAGDYDAALDLAQQILRQDPLREEIHCDAMRYYGSLGDRSGIIRQYKQLLKLLADELGASPLPATRQLCQSLLVQVEG